MSKDGEAEQCRQSHLLLSKRSQTPTLLFILTVTAIFAAESGVMLVLATSGAPLTVWQQAIIDPVLLLVLLFPLLYLFTYRPMRLHNAQLLQFGKQLEQEIAERREAEAALRKSEKQLHQLSAQLLTVQEKERQNVSRELHEDLAQSLIVLKIRLGRLQGLVKQDQPAAEREFRGASEQIDDMVWQIRRLSRDLSPAILEDLGFAAAARRLVSSYAGNPGLNSALAIDDGVDVFLKGTEGIHAYRILEEAVQNVHKHAEASQLRVSVIAKERELWLVVEDDGKGFDPSQEKDRWLGLSTMEERARMLNGSLDLWSEPGRGSRITVRIPCQGNTACRAGLSDTEGR